MPFLASTISSNGTLLAEIGSAPQKKRNSEGEVIAHKLKTQVSTFLQDGNREARWAAVVLVKAMIEVGGWGLLQDSGHWVRALLGLIGRPEPSSTKKLCIITLTRYFLLSHGNQSLVREMTTPSLPPFITACLRLSKDSKLKSSQDIIAHDSLLSTILWAFGKLIPQHPKIFKPFVDQIRTLVRPLIAAAPSTLQVESTEAQRIPISCPEIIAHKARDLFVLLNFCGPTTASSQDWERSLSQLVEGSQSTVNVVFRAFVEESESILRNGSVSQDITSHGEIYQSRKDESDWPGWTGINAGLERLNGQVLTVQSFLECPTPVPITIPISKIIGLIDRILSIIPPSERASRAGDPGTTVKPEISRDEREAVWAWLPRLHISTLALAERLVCRLDECSASFNQQLMEAVLYIFEQEQSHMNIREAVYKILPRLLAHCTSGVHRSLAPSLTACLRTCCDDLIHTRADTGSTQVYSIHPSKTSNSYTMNADLYLQRPDTSSSSENMSSLQDVAASLLSAALVHLPSAFLPFSVRSKIDRSAVLAQNELLIQTSVLNVASRKGRKHQSSLLPLLSRHFPDSYSTECLIRPRLPPLQQNSTNLSDDSLNEDADASEDREENMDPIMAEDADMSTTGSAEPTVQVNDPGRTETGRPETGTRLSKSPSLALPAKRERDSGPSDKKSNASSEPEHLLPPGGEPQRKRMRNNGDEIYVPSTTEDDSPPPLVPSPTGNPDPVSAETRPGSEQLTVLRKADAGLADDDSDDSSIPPIDPTLDTEDEMSDDDVDEDDEVK